MLNKRLAALLAALSVLLTGCYNFRDQIGGNGSAALTGDDVYDAEFDDELADIIAGDTSGYDTSFTAESSAEYTKKQSALLKETAAIAETSEFTAALGEIMEYEMLDAVPVAEAMERWYELPEVDHTPEYGYVDKLPLDPDELYERVSANTDEWINYGKVFAEKKLNEEDMRFCCEQICLTMKREIKAGLLSTMCRHFYRSLAEFVSSNDVTFEELCFIIGGWEMDVYYHFSYTDPSVPAEYTEAFLGYYDKLQLAFFESLAASMYASADELMETYQAYYTNIPSSYYDSIFSDLNEWSYVTVSCLEYDNNDFINMLYEKQSEYKTSSIYDFKH